MSLTLNRQANRWEYRCDHCKRLLGAPDAPLDPAAGYVLGVGKRVDGVFCGADRGCHAKYEHPLACSDACEDALLASWPRMNARDVYADDWGPDFRDADISTNRRDS